MDPHFDSSSDSTVVSTLARGMRVHTHFGQGSQSMTQASGLHPHVERLNGDEERGSYSKSTPSVQSGPVKVQSDYQERVENGITITCQERNEDIPYCSSHVLFLVLLSRSAMPLHVGILALQGAFREHQTCIERWNYEMRAADDPMVKVHFLRRVDQLHDLPLSGLILPGGESTAMRIVSGGSGGGGGGARGKLLEQLAAVQMDDGLPVWVCGK